jgi:hypothetical protein
LLGVHHVPFLPRLVRQSLLLPEVPLWNISMRYMYAFDANTSHRIAPFGASRSVAAGNRRLRNQAAAIVEWKGYGRCWGELQGKQKFERSSGDLDNVAPCFDFHKQEQKKRNGKAEEERSI